MPATTVPVTIKLADFGGPDVAGVTVTARLSDVEFAADGTFVGTEPVIGVTDATGTVILNVFPNAPTPTGLGTRGTSVQFTAPIPNSRPLQVEARIPNSPCSLVNTVVEDDGVPLSASQLAALGAQSSAAVATTQAGIATTGGNTATAQATIATTKAQTATDQAAIATQASADAAASYDSFDDRYLGAKAVEPLVDNDGAALLVGALYFNTAAGNMRVWTGAAWSVVSIATSAYMAGLLASATAAAARTSLGATATGSALFTAATAAAARSSLGSTVIGDAIFIAATAAAARGTLGSTATGDALFTAVTPAAARGTLGSGATGDALFLTATAAAARAAIATASTGEIQGQIFTAFTTGGTGTAYTLTPVPAIAAYAAGLSFLATFNVASGDNPTWNINGLGATVNLVKQTYDGTYTNIVAGDIPAGHRSRVTMITTTLALVESLPPKNKQLGNRIINAGMRVAQYSAVGLTGVGGSTIGPCDRFINAISATAVTATLVQSASPVPGIGQYGFVTQYGITSTTGTTTIAASQSIESKNVADLNAQKVVFSAVVMHDTGAPINFTPSLIKPTALDNYAGNSVIATGPTVSVPSGVPTKIEMVTILGASDATNGIRCFLQSAGFPAVATKHFYHADWYFNAGDATPSDGVEHSDYGQELMKCRRYARPNMPGFFIGYIFSTTSAEFVIPVAPPMRVAPTFTALNANAGFLGNGSAGNIPGTWSSAGSLPDSLLTLYTRSSGTWTAGQPINCNDTSAQFSLSAEIQ